MVSHGISIGLIYLVIEYSRSSRNYPKLINRQSPLPDFIGDILELALEVDEDYLEQRASEISLDAFNTALLVFLKNVLFAGWANNYRILGLNKEAELEKIVEHRQHLIGLYEKGIDYGENNLLRVIFAHNALVQLANKSNLVIDPESVIKIETKSNEQLDSAAQVDISKTDELLPEAPEQSVESNQTNFQQSGHDSDIDEFARLDELSDYIEQIQKQTGAIYAENIPSRAPKAKNDAKSDDHISITSQIDVTTSHATEKKVSKTDLAAVSTSNAHVKQNNIPNPSPELKTTGHGEIFKQAVEARKNQKDQPNEILESQPKHNKRWPTFTKTATIFFSIILIWVVSLILEEPQEEKMPVNNQIASNQPAPQMEEQPTTKKPLTDEAPLIFGSLVTNDKPQHLNELALTTPESLTDDDRDQDLGNDSISQLSGETVESLPSINLDRLIGIHHSEEDVKIAVTRSKLKHALKKSKQNFLKEQ